KDLRSYALTACRRIDVNRAFHRETITWPGPKVSKRAESSNRTAVHCHQHRVTLLLTHPPPRDSFLRRRRPFGVNRSRGREHLVVDCRDFIEVLFNSVSNLHSLCLLWDQSGTRKVARPL